MVIFSDGHISGLKLQHSLMPNQVWRQLVEANQLQASKLNTICDWAFADYILKTEWDVMASTIKIRKAGFSACMDTEQMYQRLLTQLKTIRVIP